MANRTFERMQNVPKLPEEMADRWNLLYSFPSSLPREAADNLGYKRLLIEKKTWLSSVVTEIDIEVLTILHDLEIMPFELKEIKEYQKNIADKFNMPVKKRGKLGGILLIFSAIALTYFICLCSNGIKIYGWFIPVAIFLFIYSIASISQDLFFWASIKINEYQREIPLFAIHHANEIKKKLPDTEFFIEELTCPLFVDPFLVMVYREKKYYIDVWDELKFLSER